MLIYQIIKIINYQNIVFILLKERLKIKSAAKYRETYIPEDSSN